MAQTKSEEKAQIEHFRWEDRTAVGHHCVICHTFLLAEKAKHTCLGKHVEPCARYHRHLHCIGKSHLCSACMNADRLHEDRHKHIADVIKQYRDCQNIDDEQDQRGNELSQQSPGIKGGKKKERKAEKKAAKALKRPKIVVTTEDVQRVADAIHWNRIVAADGRQREADTSNMTPKAKAATDAMLAFFPDLGMARSETVPGGPSFKGKSDVNIKLEASLIMAYLEVDSPDNCLSKALADLATNIYDRVREDLVATCKEEAETQRLKAAYLRYAGRKNFEASDIRDESWTGSEDVSHVGYTNADPSSSSAEVDAKGGDDSVTHGSAPYSHPANVAKEEYLESVKNLYAVEVAQMDPEGIVEPENPRSKNCKMKGRYSELLIDNGTGVTTEDPAVVQDRRAERNRKKKAKRKEGREKATTSNKPDADMISGAACEDEPDEPEKNFTVVCPQHLFNGWLTKHRAETYRDGIDRCTHGAYVVTKDQFFAIHHSMNLSIANMINDKTCACVGEKLEDMFDVINEDPEQFVSVKAMSLAMSRTTGRLMIMASELKGKDEHIQKLSKELKDLKDKVGRVSSP